MGSILPQPRSRRTRTRLFPAASFLAPALGGAGLQYLGRAHWAVVAAVGPTAAGLHLAAGPSRERHAAAIRAETAAASVPDPAKL